MPRGLAPPNPRISRAEPRRLGPIAMLGAALLAVACGPGGAAEEEPAPRRALVGTYDLVTVDGDALPAVSPEEPNVLIESLGLTLAEDGGYALTSGFRLDGNPAPTSTTIGGTWQATATTLTFHGDQGPAVVEFGYRYADDALHLQDEAGHEWVLRRRR